MRVCHLNSTERGGGAGRAANRLHRALRARGVDSRMLVQSRSTDDPSVHSPHPFVADAVDFVRPLFDYLPRERYRGRTNNPFSPAWLPERRHNRIREIDPDVVHCHWIARGFVRIETLGALDRPIVWTLHDMWAFTGGCHYSRGCERYTDACGACPELGSDTENDLSRWVWNRKADIWPTLDLTVVTPSTWLAERARESSLLGDIDTVVIPNPIDTELFTPAPRDRGRDLFGLPTDRPVVLFGAMDATANSRKGFQHLVPALRAVARDRPDVVAAVFGADRPDDPPDVGLDIRYLGYVNQDDLPLMYACSDAVVIPSEIDNLPNTMVEGLACGTPCVAFDVGGIPELVSHRENGYLADPFDTEDLAAGIRWTIAKNRRERLGRVARETAVDRCAEPVVASHFEELYAGL